MSRLLPLLLLHACVLPSSDKDAVGDSGRDVGLAASTAPAGAPEVGTSDGDTAIDSGVGDTGADDTSGGPEDTAPDTGGARDTGSGSARGPCPPTLTGTPGLHVTLEWDEDVDLDLHLLNRPDAWFQVPDDCNYCNLDPDWGSAGVADDDPALSVDALYPGCEVIDIPIPAAGEYTLRAHYFRDGSGAGPATPTVQVWADGDRIGEATGTFAENEVWEIGLARFPDAVFTPATTAPWASDLRTCE